MELSVGSKKQQSPRKEQSNGNMINNYNEEHIDIIEVIMKKFNSTK